MPNLFSAFGHNYYKVILLHFSPKEMTKNVPKLLQVQHSIMYTPETERHGVGMPAKKIKRNLFRILRRPLIYIDDIQAIQDLIKSELKPRSFEIKTQNYIYNDVSEIPESQNRTSEIEINTSNPYINIDLRKNSANMSAEQSLNNQDDNNRIAGVFLNLYQAILRKKERAISYYIAKFSGLILGAIFVALVIFDKKPYHLFTAYLFFAFPLWAFATYLNENRFSCFIATPYTKHFNFFTRNKDKIILGVISAISGMGLSHINWLFNKLF